MAHLIVTNTYNYVEYTTKYKLARFKEVFPIFPKAGYNSAFVAIFHSVTLWDTIT